MAQISTLLLPAGSMLLPPSGTVLPPPGCGMLMNDGSVTGQELAARLDRAGAEAREMAARAGAEAKILAERMAVIAADKIPEIKQRAEDVMRSAKAVWADSDKRDTFIAAHGRKLIIGGAALLVLAGGGYVFAKRQATTVARERIDGFLVRTGLASSVTYTGISGSPFGSATLSGVTVKQPGRGVVAKADLLEVSGIETNGDTLVAANMAANAFEIPILALARQYRGAPIAGTAIGLGYTTLKGNFSLSVVFDDEKKTFSLSTKGNVNDLGSINAAVKFGGMSSAFAGALIALSQSGRQADPLGLMTNGIAGLQSVMQATLMDADLAVDNTGWFKRARTITASNMPPDDLVQSARSPGAEGINEDALVRAGMARSDAEAATEAARKWFADGGTLRITTHIGEPIPLIKSTVFFAGPAFAFDNFAEFIAASKAKISSY